MKKSIIKIKNYLLFFYLVRNIKFFIFEPENYVTLKVST